MVTIFGLPADGVVLMVTVLVLTLLAFWLSELRSCAKVVRASKRQVAQFKKLHQK